MKNASNTFYLIRHAHTVFTPDENRPLSHRGKRDGERIAGILRQLPIDQIYSSPYGRAFQTVEPLANQLGLPIQIEPDLRERKLSEKPVKNFSDAVRATWRDFSFAHPGGESNAAARQRGLGVIQRLLNQNSERHIVISTHGNLLALILNSFDPSIGFDFWKSLTLPDIFSLTFGTHGAVKINRLWRDIES